MGLLDGLCRFCSQELDPVQSKNIFYAENKHLLDTAMRCVPVPMSSDDRYPKLACIHCVFKLSVVTEFHDMSLSSFKVFDELLAKEDEPMIQSDPNQLLDVKFEVFSGSELVQEEQNYQMTEVTDCGQNVSSNQYSSDNTLTGPSRPRPFICDECGKGFLSKHHLLSHKMIHTGEKPFQCDACDQKFCRKSDLVVHKRIHTGEKPFQCEVCRKDFSKKSALVQHRERHSKTRIYPCEECGRAFGDKLRLTNHKLTHS